jgi:2-polyprenyl-3-methyl-5-hydroxy-6-metoxy-1,4-benzoquinol methylase
MKKNKILYQDKKYQIKLDRKYGYYHIFPIPDKKELAQYYEREFYSAKYNKQINDSSKKVQQKEEEFINSQYEDVLEIIGKEAPGKKIIDIGCGYGNFMKFCWKRGFKTFGIDPSADAVNYAKAGGLRAIKADIEDFKDLIKEKYDAAVMLNVFEHLRKPYEILKVIRDNILAEGGLLIIRVPNEFNRLQLIANEKYNLKKWWVAIPQHINYFTVKHLVKLVEKSGYEIFMKEATFPLEMFILLGDQYVGDSKLGKIIHQKRVLFEKTLKEYDNNYKRQMYQKFAEIELGREVVIYARKK